MTLSRPSDRGCPTDSNSPEAILVRTSTTDPIASLSAASVDPSCGRLLAVLATLPRDRLERRLSEVGCVPEDSRVVEFVRNDDAQRRRETGDGRQVHGGLAGLAIEVVGEFDWLVSDGNGVVYLDSLEPYVSAAGLESTFRFIVIIAARARSSGVTLVARLGDGTLEPSLVEVLAEAFDRTVTQPATDEVEEAEDGETEGDEAGDDG